MRRMYSENQLVNALENKDVKVKTIEQTQANYSLNIESLAWENLSSDVSFTFAYGRLEIINNVLYIICTGTFNNATESNKSIVNLSMRITIPTALASKIIDISGKSVVDTSSNKDISADYGFAGDISYPSNLNRSPITCCITNTSQANTFVLNAYFGGKAINAGQSIAFSFRTFLTIL